MAKEDQKILADLEWQLLYQGGQLNNLDIPKICYSKKNNEYIGVYRTASSRVKNRIAVSHKVMYLSMFRETRATTTR